MCADGDIRAMFHTLASAITLSCIGFSPRGKGLEGSCQPYTKEGLSTMSEDASGQMWVLWQLVFFKK